MSDDAKTRFNTVRDLFVDAMAQPTSRRSEWLADQCGTDSALQREVQELLDETVVQNDPLEQGVLAERKSDALDFLPEIPGYQVLRRMAVGGQAIVFEATQNSTQQSVAIKILRIGRFSTGEERARFERETQALAKVQHAHIVPIIDSGQTDDGMQFLVTQLVDGWPIDKYLDQRLYGSDSRNTGVLRLFVKVAKAVQFAHDRGVIHRDLKPSNILVDKEGEPRLLDFGLAKPLGDSESHGDHLTIDGGFLGSLPWASPEQARGKSTETDHRSDVYSLGVILYQMLTEGEFPYQVVGNMRDVLDNILNAEPTPPAEAARLRHQSLGLQHTEIHPTIEAIVLRALEKSPEQRFQSAREMAQAVEEYLAGRSPKVEGQSPRESGFQSSQSSNRIAFVVLGGICLVFATAGAWFLGGGSTSQRSDSGPSETTEIEKPSEEVFVAPAIDALSEQEFETSLIDLVERGENRAASNLYREWHRSHPWTVVERASDAFFFEGGQGVYLHGTATPQQIEVGRTMYRAFVESHAGILELSLGVAGTCGAARVKLGYLSMESKDSSARALSESFDSANYLGRLVLASNSPANLLALSELHVCLGRQLLQKRSLRSAISSFEQNLELKSQALEEEAVLEYAEDFADLALLLYMLPGGENQYKRGDGWIGRALEKDSENARFLAIRAIGNCRSRKFDAVDDDLARASQVDAQLPLLALVRCFAAFVGNEDIPEDALQEVRFYAKDLVEPTSPEDVAMVTLLGEMERGYLDPEEKREMTRAFEEQLQTQDLDSLLRAYRDFVRHVPNTGDSGRKRMDHAMMGVLEGLEEIESRRRFCSVVRELLETQWFSSAKPSVELAISSCRWIGLQQTKQGHRERSELHRSMRILESLPVDDTTRGRRDAASGELLFLLAEDSARQGKLDESIHYYSKAAEQLKSSDDPALHAQAAIRAIGLRQLTPWRVDKHPSELNAELQSLRQQGGDAARIDYLIAMSAAHLHVEDPDRALAMLTEIESPSDAQQELIDTLTIIAKHRIGESDLLQQSIRYATTLQARLLYAELQRKDG